MARLHFSVVDGDHLYVAGDEVPDELADKILGRTPSEPTDPQDTGDQPPAKSEKKEVWAAYATAHGVQVADTATKDEIVAAVEAAAA